MVVRRYGTRGRPPKGMQPTLTEGVLVKMNGSMVVLEANGKRMWVDRSAIISEAADGRQAPELPASNVEGLDAVV